MHVAALYTEKNSAVFAEYRDAIEGISELGEVRNGGREFFTKLPVTFLEKFVASYVKLVESCWRHWKIVSYVVAGDPTLAQLYLNWLVAVDEGHEMEDYCFPRKLIKLENHVSSNATIEVDTRECMEYLTAVADPAKILEDPLIKDNKVLLWQWRRPTLR